MNNKLLPALRSLQPTEYARWEAFLRSPYHNSRPRCLACWEYWKALAPDFVEEGGSLEAFHLALFPDKPFRQQRALDEISHLYQLLKRFWEAEALQKDPFLQRSLRLRQLSERRLDRLYAVERKAAQKLLQQSSAGQELLYQTQLSWATIDNEQFGRQQLRTVDDSLGEKLEALDLSYLIPMLRESCEALNRQHILNSKYEFLLLPAILELLSSPQHPYRQIPLISIYLHIYQSLQPEATETDHEQLLLILRQHRATFSMAEQRAMYKFAQNFCIRKINEGCLGYDLRLFDLFRELLNEDILLIDGQLSHTDCKNIVTIGVRIKALDWVSQFLDTYGPKVDDAFRENVLAYCRASLEAEKGHPQRAIRLLSAISHTDVHYQLSARQLLLRIYFYEEDMEGILYTIDAFRHFLQRNKEIPKARREYHLNFLRLFKRLSLLRDRLPTYSRQEARQRIQQFHLRLVSSKSLANRAWLEEEVAALEAAIRRQP